MQEFQVSFVHSDPRHFANRTLSDHMNNSIYNFLQVLELPFKSLER